MIITMLNGEIVFNAILYVMLTNSKSEYRLI
jgi:hypothetical protein